MTYNQLYDELIELLLNHFDERESKNIANIYIIDRFNQNKKSDKIVNQNDFIKFLGDKEKFINNYPLQYITGKTFFYKNFFQISDSVLIPRPETEELVDLCIKEIKNNNFKKILDIGTGSGCISITIALECIGTMIDGIDISCEALEIAKINKSSHISNNVQFKQIDFLNESNWKYLGNYDLIVSNPPYISISEKLKIASNTLKYEPHIALFAPGSDPLIFYKKIVDFALNGHLNSNGLILCEINEFSTNVISNYLNWKSVNYEIIFDMQGKERILKIKL